MIIHLTYRKFPRDLFRTRLQEAISEVSLAQIRPVLEYVLLPGGKFIRPRFAAALFSDLAGGQDEEFLDFLNLLPALELIHVATLLHDDLPAIDNDDLRRGKASCHKKFGEGMTLLTANFMFSYALESVFKTSYSTAIKAEYFNTLAHAYSAINIGQILDLDNKINTISDYENIIAHKTAPLFTAAATLVANVLELSNEEKLLLQKFAKSYGLLFQIKNDWLEFSGKCQILGRSESSDRRNNKINIFSEQFDATRSLYLMGQLKILESNFFEMKKLDSCCTWDNCQEFYQEILNLSANF